MTWANAVYCDRTVYNLCDTHRGVCRPAVLKRRRQDSQSTVETISTAESDLDIPRELREPRGRSPSLFVPAPTTRQAQSTSLHSGLALPARGISQALQASASSNDEPTPDLTPATTHTSAQTKSPTPDPGAFTAYLEDLLRSLDDPAPGLLPDAGTIDPNAIMAALDQPLSLDLGLPESTGEWRKGATGAHSLLTSMGSEGRKALQPRLKRAVSVLQTMNGVAAVRGTAKEARPFAESDTDRQRMASPYPFEMAMHGYSPAPGEDDDMQLDGNELPNGRRSPSMAEDAEEASSDDAIPPESLINPAATRLPNGWHASRQASAEQYVSPMNLHSPAKSHSNAYEPEEDNHPFASTSAAGALLEAAASGETPAKDLVTRDADGDIDIYAIFPSYRHAEATIMANGQKCGLPLKVAWSPSHPSADGSERRGACLVCVHAGPENAGIGCEYSVRLSDDNTGKWRMVTSQGEHMESCYPPKPSKKGKGRARPVKAAAKEASRKKGHRRARTSYLGAPGTRDRTSLPTVPGESFGGAARRERGLSPISSFPSSSNTAARNPLLPKRSYMRPRSGSGSDSSSPGVVVQASWKPQSPYKSQNQEGSSISPNRREKLNKSGGSIEQPIDLDEVSADEKAPTKKRKVRPRPRFAEHDEVMEISSGEEQAAEEEEDEPALPPPLSASHPSPQQSQAAARGNFARKKLPPSPSHRTPTKPFQARRPRPKSRRPGYAWIEEPIFIADPSGSASKSGAAKELSANYLNGGYWRKVDDTGNIVHEHHVKEEGRALRSRRRAVQTDGVGGKKPVETIVERRRVRFPGDIDGEEDFRIQSSEDEEYKDPGQGDTPRSLRSQATRNVERPALRSTRARDRRSHAPPAAVPRLSASPGLSFQSQFAFGDDNNDGDDFPTPYNDDDSPPSPAIAKSALPVPQPRRRSAASRAAAVKTEVTLSQIPNKLIGHMSLASIGFSQPQTQLLRIAGYSTVSQLTREGLLCSKEDFTKFREQFHPHSLSAQKASRADVKAVVVKIVWEIRANAVLEWEAAGMMESDYEEEEEENGEEAEE